MCVVPGVCEYNSWPRKSHVHAHGGERGLGDTRSQFQPHAGFKRRYVALFATPIRLNTGTTHCECQHFLFTVEVAIPIDPPVVVTQIYGRLKSGR